MQENNIKSEPSYGMLVFNQRHGYEQTLFGSSIKHNDIISMTLTHGAVKRELNSDMYFGKSTICDIQMSYSQFAEAITSFGMGAGVPVTLRYTEKDGRIDPPEFESKTQQYKDEFKQHMTDINSNMIDTQNRIDELLEKKTLTKSEKKEIHTLLAMLSQDLVHNTPFIMDQYSEQMDNMLKDAKGEIEAFAHNRMQSIVDNAIVKSNDLLNADTEIPVILDKKETDKL